jgi:hypothetical protein
MKTQIKFTVMSAPPASAGEYPASRLRRATLPKGKSQLPRQNNDAGDKKFVTFIFG